MLSQILQSELEREVVGQKRAIHTIVRTVTVALSGLGKQEGALGIYLLVGPSGTGKTHMARTLVRLLHGDLRRLAVVDCVQVGREDWSTLAHHLAVHFRYPVVDGEDPVLRMAPLSVLLVEHLEAARPELVQALVSALETGHLMLEDGKCGSLQGCLVLLTSALCAREIFEAGRKEIGFTPAADLQESEKARIYQLCTTAAEKQWGPDLLGHVDDLIVFHRLREGHLPFILERFVMDLNQELAARQLSCTLEPSATRYLLSRAGSFLQHGGWFMAKVFRRFVLFPVADLVHGGQLAAGSRIRVELEGKDRLRFTVDAPQPGSRPRLPGSTPPVSIPVDWEDATAPVR